VHEDLETEPCHEAPGFLGAPKKKEMIRGRAVDRYVEKHPSSRPRDVEQDSHRLRGAIKVLEYLAEHDAVESVCERSHDHRIEEVA
jgi:hypothetical protein